MIELANVTKRFGDLEVLRGVTLTVPTGCSTVLLGASGSGKSVLLKTVMGILAPDEGEIWVGGRALTSGPRDALASLRAQVGYVFQSSALFDSLTVAENILFGLPEEWCRTNERGCRERVRECLRWVNLDTAVADKYPAELSGGMRKRVAIARAIAGRQRYVLYDEPTTGLDPMNAGIIAVLIRRLQAELGVTSIVVTHDLDLARRVGDRAALLYDGRIHVEAPAACFETLDDPVVRAFVRPEVLERSA
jgi:phospholipid/cholesterol/gamma-HCH transport system ATP-binding protein